MWRAALGGAMYPASERASEREARTSFRADTPQPPPRCSGRGATVNTWQSPEHIAHTPNTSLPDSTARTHLQPSIAQAAAAPRSLLLPQRSRRPPAPSPAGSVAHRRTQQRIGAPAAPQPAASPRRTRPAALHGAAAQRAGGRITPREIVRHGEAQEGAARG